MLVLVRRTLSLIQLEIRTLRRLARFWIVASILSFYQILGYVVTCIFMVHHAPSSPTFGANSPLYALSGIDPKFFLLFQVAALVLIFDTSHRNVSSNFHAVLDSRPASCVQFLLSRVLSVAFLLWLVMFFNLATLQVIGLLAESTRWEFASAFQLHSFFNLVIIDAPVFLLFWSSIFTFLCSLMRFRLLTLLCALTAMFVWYAINQTDSFALHSLVSPSSNDTLFVSDLIPEVTSVPTLLLRGATALGSLALILVTATLSHRIDHRSLLVHVGRATTVSLIAVTIYFVGTKTLLSPYETITRWHEAHKSQIWGDTLDLMSLFGTMTIDPKRYLNMDLTLRYRLKSSHSEERLIFCMNPGLTIQSLEWNGSNKNFRFEQGLLELYDINHLEVNSTHTLRVKTYGVPDPKFAYFDSAIDIYNDARQSRQLVRLFGKDGTVYNRNFIALMPGGHWYPKVGALTDPGPESSLSKDYFDVDLRVHLVPDRWQLVASTEFSTPKSKSSNYHLQSQAPVPELGIFASRFHKFSTSIDEFTLDIYTHANHSENLKLLNNLDDAMRAKLRNVIAPDTGIEIAYPRKRAAIVEIPRRLRTVGGGWRMDSLQALPGVVLIKEHSFPTTKFRILFNRISARKHDFDSADQIDRLWSYFKLGIASENPLMDIPKHNWLHYTSATGEFATVLDLVAMELIALLRSSESGSFSIYSTSHIAPRTKISPFAAIDAIADVYTFFNSLTTWVRKTRRLEFEYGSRLSVQDAVEGVGFSDVPTSLSHQYDFELLAYKSRQIALSILSANSSQHVAKWLADMRDRFRGRNYDYEEMLEVAQSHDILVEPVLTEWLSSSTLPGYVVSSAVSSRIVDENERNVGFQTSIMIRNVQPVSGFLHVSLPSEESALDESPDYVSVDEAILLKKNSAIRVNVQTSYELPSVRLNFGLSLNRKPLTLTTTRSESRVERGAPFIQSSHWSPEPVGIVVDDLDTGFSIPDRKDFPKSQTRSGLFRWIQTLDGEAVVEFDHYLPKYDASYERFYRNHWTRVVSGSPRVGGFGKFRKTWAEVWVDSRNKHPPPAKFSTKLPDTRKWQLEYYAPIPAHDIYDGPFPLRFTISDHSKQVVHDVSEGKWKQGWNTVGTFDVLKGLVDVEVSISGPIPSSGELLFADAIRWSAARPQSSE